MKILIAFIGLILFYVGIGLTMNNNGSFLGVILATLGIAIIIISVKSIKTSVEKRKNLKKEEEIRKENERKLEEIAKIKSEGKWEFPIEEFYNRCCDLNATKLLDKYHFEKMKKVALDILERNDIPEESYHFYFSDEKVKQYFESGKSDEEINDEKEREEIRKAYITPQDAELDDETRKGIEFNSRLKDLLYEKKRETIITENINELAFKISELSKAVDDTEKLSSAVAGSAYLEKEHDWATLGGISNGIAGPAAGISVAADAMKDNERIREQNSANLAYAANLSVIIQKAGQNAIKRIEGLQSELNEYKDELNELKFKTVIKEIDTQKIFNKLKIEPELKHDFEKYSVSVKFTNDYNEDLPEDFKMVTDGTVNVKIYCDGIFVEDVCVPLPEEGILCNGGCTTESVPLTKYMENFRNREFSYEIRPNHLWIMEL